MNYKNYNILNIVTLLILFVLVPNITYAATFSKTQAVDRNQNCTSGMFCRLIAYWTFDGGDIVNGVVKDMSATTTPSNGTMSNISTSTFYTSGKIGQALNFDGVDDAVLIGTVPALHASTSNLTISAWIKPSKVTVGALCIVCNSNTGGGIVPWALEFNSTAGRFSLAQAGAGSGTVRVVNNTTLKKDVWYHVVVVRTFVDTLNWPVTVYLNGVADGSGTIQRAGYAGQTIAIGKYGQINGNYFQGAIDDIRIYSRAMSANEVNQLYNSGISKFASSRPIISTTTCTDRLSCGLVGYWTFDGKDISNGRVLDKSGGVNHGNLVNIATTTFYTSGEIGQAFNFDGGNDYVEFGDVNVIDNATSLSSCAWVKHNSVTDDDIIFSKTNGTDDGIFFMRDDVGAGTGRTDMYKIYIAESSGTDNVYIEGANNSSPLGKWTFVCFSFTENAANGLRLYVNGVEDANSPASTVGIIGIDSVAQPLRIGMRSDTVWAFNGSIDDVRIYNRVLSSSEITALYNSGISKFAASPSTLNKSSCSFGPNCGLVGYWTFDGKDMSNGRVLDKSGNNNHGNLVSIATTTFYAPGRVGQGANFDGTDDYLLVNDSASLNMSTTNAFTLATWVMFKEFPGSYKPFFYKTNAPSFWWNESGSGILFRPGGTVSQLIVNTTPSIKLNKWYHLAASYDGTTEKIYMNGALIGQQTSVGTSGSNSDQLYIGGYPGSSFKKQMDDVRIYNRALSDAEVRQLYSIGK